MNNQPEVSGLSQAGSDINATEKPAQDTPLRFVTAASLFDGHDAAINIMRRLIQAQGCEVIHLGHNRGVLDIVRAAIQKMLMQSPFLLTRAATTSFSAL